MKKQENKTNTKTASNKKASTKKESANEAPKRVTLKFRTVDDILFSAFSNENKVVFDLVEKQNGADTVTFTIYPTDMDFDNAILNVFGFSVRCLVRQGKSGMFLSFPSRKGKDGNYYDDVVCYDKNFHALMKELLAAYYMDEESADE